ncbi:MAG: NAD(P)-dependent oxidoreductase [Myxococcota bacterium]
MTTLVVGATGATGRCLVQHLLGRGQRVRAIVRSKERMPDAIRRHPELSLIEASLLELKEDELRDAVAGSGAIASCLGHNLSLRGVFGPPHRLVSDATQRLCQAARHVVSTSPIRFVLMNSAGVQNRSLNESASRRERVVLGLLRLFLPPHADNEAAAEYLRTKIGPDDAAIEWVVVRPDSLFDADEVSPYTLHASPERSALFDPGKTSRINVGHFMAELITQDEVWSRWKGQMPVLYDA